MVELFSQMPVESAGALDFNLQIRPVVADRYSASEVGAGEGEIVVVNVFGPSKVPTALKETRAQVKAVESLGVMNVAVENIKDIFLNMDVERATTVRNVNVFKDDIDYIKRITPDDIIEDYDVASLEVVTVEVLVDGDFNL